jgi:uncharacterized protein (UPF0332 family)
MFLRCFCVAGRSENVIFKAFRGTGLFPLHFVKPGSVPVEISRIYNDLFERRQEGDYEDFFVFTESDVNPWLGETAQFIQKISELVRKEMAAG